MSRGWGGGVSPWNSPRGVPCGSSYPDAISHQKYNFPHPFSD